VSGIEEDGVADTRGALAKPRQPQHPPGIHDPVFQPERTAAPEACPPHRNRLPVPFSAPV